MMIALRPKPTIQLLVALLLALSALALASSPALAKVVHQKEGVLHTEEVPPEGMGFLLTGDAVNQVTGNVYVLESNAFELGLGAVDVFKADGTYAGLQITGAEVPGGTFALGLQSGVAVDNSLSLNSGSIYVADTEHGAIDRFSTAGVYECQITTVEAASPSECDLGGSELEGSFAPEGLAVDSSGDVFVADDANAVVDEFAPAGNKIARIEDAHLTSTMGSVAVDTAGRLYVTNYESNVVEFDAAGKFIRVLDEAASVGVGIDPSNNHVYAAQSTSPGRIAEYGEDGALIDVFAEGDSGSSQSPALAVDGASGRLYAAQFFVAPGTVSIFGPDIEVPNVTAGAATGVGETTATLHGEVDPDGAGPVVECRFEYVTNQQFAEHPEEPFESASTAACEPAPPYVAATAVAATVPVSASTSYHFRLAAANADGVPGLAEGEPFTTGGPPRVDSETAVAHDTTAVLSTKINPFGSPTTCQVQYVNDASFKESGYAHATTLPCSPEALGSGFGDQAASVALSGLHAGTTYHYHFIASNAAGQTVGAEETFATFGIKSYSFEVLDQQGHDYTQAGGHPYAMNISFDLSGEGAAEANVKDTETALPPGLIGNPTAVSRCSREQLTDFQCSGSSQVGLITLRTSGGTFQDIGLYNLVPPAGVPAEFGARFNTFSNLYIDSNARTGGDYGITARVENASAAIGVLGATVQLWGVPADPSHDAERLCPPPAGLEEERGPCSAGSPLLPFLTNPSSCSGPQTTSMRVDSWQNPGDIVSTTSTLPATTGCEQLRFTPSATLQPDTAQADSPAGLHFDLKIPQNEDPNGLSQPELKSTTVTLPPGMTINPSAANGRQACSPAEIGLHEVQAPTCPDASKIGSVEISTPLLSDTVTGGVYLAEQNNNPFGSLLAIYIAAEVDGARIKLAGHVIADPVSGQLVTTFDETPQLPFDELKLDLFGGPRGALATPEACGSYATQTLLTPWSANAPVGVEGAFPISTSCVSGFAPVQSAGTVNNQAGAFSPFTFTLSRSDVDQRLGAVSVKTPPGLLGKLSGIPRCPEPQATAGQCPAESQIGETTVASGVGPEPFWVRGGRVYLTGPYNGGPFGLSIVVPAVAGPFNLGNVVVRSSIRVDPTTAQITVASDPLPQMINSIEGLNSGIPADLRTINVVINRPGFMFNPTNCTASSVLGTITSVQGAAAVLSSPFQAANCANLPFKPKLTASTQGKTSKANGASLKVKIAYPAGVEANIAKVDLEIPKILPSRLTTIQKACPEAQFNANPAGCSPSSVIASAVVHTPLLSAPLTGPAYFVSHGGEAFPDVEMVLEGEGVTLIVDGKTQIKNGVTFSHFETVPDAPFTSFEFDAPKGPHSIFAANGNLCAATKTVTVRKHVTRRVHGRHVHVVRLVKQKVAAPVPMPTKITGQNGAVLTQTTPIIVTGCPVPKKTNAKRQHKHAKATGHRISARRKP